MFDCVVSAYVSGQAPPTIVFVVDIVSRSIVDAIMITITRGGGEDMCCQGGMGYNVKVKCSTRICTCRWFRQSVASGLNVLHTHWQNLLQPIIITTMIIIM